MTWKTKAILNYIVFLIFLVLAALHIQDGKDLIRVCADVIPMIWFFIYASYCINKHRK